MAKKVKTIKVAKIWADNQWTVRFGGLNPGPGRPEAVQSLFKVVGEKLPFEAINAVRTTRSAGTGYTLPMIRWDTLATLDVAGFFKGCVRV